MKEDGYESDLNTISTWIQREGGSVREDMDVGIQAEGLRLNPQSVAVSLHLHLHRWINTDLYP